MTWQQPPAPYQPPMPYTAKPGWTRKRVIIPSAVGLFFFGVIVGSAGSGDATTNSAPASAASAKPAPAVTVTATAKPVEAKPAPTVTETVTAKAAAKPADAKSGDETAKVANFIGMGLQEAQDAAQADGFFLLKSHDSSGASRLQVFDRNWKVCTQNVAAGKSVSVGTQLDFGSVKLTESCP
ncbi:hypothetical protein ACFYRC_26290 [Streptomyces sp. NPDC005279]|uniref:PASTA domain-containing protein n=1 Tax=Streptomyces sp. NPDC005279 TaxID=3364712 RepID=UPI0036BD41A9